MLGLFHRISVPRSPVRPDAAPDAASDVATSERTTIGRFGYARHVHTAFGFSCCLCCCFLLCAVVIEPLLYLLVPTAGEWTSLELVRFLPRTLGPGLRMMLIM